MQNSQHNHAWIVQDKSMVTHQLKAEIIKYNYIKYGALQATAFQEQWESTIWNSSFATDE